MKALAVAASLLILGGCGASAPSLSDAETLWCNGHEADVGRAGAGLSLAFPKGTFDVYFGSQAENGQVFLTLDVDPATVWASVELDKRSLENVVEAWKTEGAPEYVRACKAAFGMK